ncbi:hypothetical protein XH98_15965 [Bradyrhizobium sp. CCBAU 51745]|uniref:hypothetical protein n=1 Tax=Bradyrhizobium sp. CCBAU 51745 TaxID=1325099 RepID=UPI0023065C30|nr:hypothetical protein [Bradyrhizobium sp. CCBAU 51745]MDA9440578.1 hypothetical protein [Bradyrhizobium sp. CCBAU 51745]
MIFENEGTDDPNQLGEAVQELKKAEDHLAHARAEEAEAEHEVDEAIEKVEAAVEGLVEVHVVHVNEVEKASFKEKKTATLQHVWDEAYLKLGIARQPKDVFQTGGEHPKSLMSHLGLSLEQAKDQKVIENYHFGIASETGGA